MFPPGASVQPVHPCNRSLLHASWGWLPASGRQPCPGGQRRHQGRPGRLLTLTRSHLRSPESYIGLRGQVIHESLAGRLSKRCPLRPPPAQWAPAVTAWRGKSLVKTNKNCDSHRLQGEQVLAHHVHSRRPRRPTTLHTVSLDLPPKEPGSELVGEVAGYP